MSIGPARIALLSTLCSLPVLPPATAQTGEESVAPAEEGQVLELSLDEFVRLVLARNLDLKLSEIDNEITSTQVEQALGGFDPELFASVSGADSESPTASIFTASATQTLDANTGLRGALSTGASYSLAYDMRYARQKPTNPFFAFNPNMNSSVALSITQPLLRDRGSRSAEREVEQARLQVKRGDHDLMQRVEDTAFGAVSAYWSYVLQVRRVATAELALSVAEELERNNRQRRDAGLMIGLDVLTAQAEVARRRESLIRAQNLRATAEDDMKALLAPGESVQDWDVSVVPTSEPALRTGELPDQARAAETALAQRADLRALETDLRRADLNLVLAEQDRLPQVDVSASYGLAGLGGKTSGTDPVTGQPLADNDGNWDIFRESVTPIRQSQFEAWSVGLDFAYPIGNRTAGATLRRSQLDKERAWLTISQHRMNIVQEVRSALRDVKDAQAATRAAEDAVSLALEQYRAEQTRLANDAATTFQVREAQRDWLEAQDTLTNALIDYEVALARLSQVQGALAESHGVEWEPDDARMGAIYD